MRYYALIYSHRIGRNAIIKIIARGEAQCKLFWLLHEGKPSAIITVIARGEAAECDIWNNRVSPNPIPVLSNEKMRLWNLLHELFLLYSAIMKIIAFSEIFKFVVI